MKTKEFKPVIAHFGYAPEKDKMFDDEIYCIIHEHGAVRSVTFLCPCGCGLPIYILEGDKYEGGSGTRKITVVESNGAFTWVTIDPSIKVNGGCNSHFWIKDNKVIL